jgi:spermidine/putrescine transport system ATP-binding protein
MSGHDIRTLVRSVQLRRARLPLPHAKDRAERVIIAGALWQDAPAAGTKGVEVAEIDVRLERVSKLFGDVAAVDDLSLDIAEGEFFSMLGPSGCGKTTTLRMIGGFEDPTLGTVYLGGRDVTDLPPYKRDINTVFQSYALFPHLNVFENVAFGLRRKKVAKDEVATRVADAMRLVDLQGFEQRKPPQMSGGQQQRVALARALVNHPKVLLLDEPLGALDLKLRKQMQLELKRIQQEVGITFIYVTHDQEEAMTMSNRLAVMRHGKIEQLGEPEFVYENPATEFVAGFLGASNLLEGEVKEASNGLSTILLNAGGTMHVPTARVPSGAGDRVKVGVRPEKISIARGGGDVPAELNGIPATVTMSTYIGVSHQYKVQAAGGATLTVYVQNLGAEEAPQQGEPVVLTWKPEHTFAVTPQDGLSTEEEEE